jgi:hypothetical protein
MSGMDMLVVQLGGDLGDLKSALNTTAEERRAWRDMSLAQVVR